MITEYRLERCPLENNEGTETPEDTMESIIAGLNNEAAMADMEQYYTLDDAAEAMREFSQRLDAVWAREKKKYLKAIEEAACGY